MATKAKPKKITKTASRKAVKKIGAAKRKSPTKPSVAPAVTAARP